MATLPPRPASRLRSTSVPALNRSGTSNIAPPARQRAGSYQIGTDPLRQSPRCLENRARLDLQQAAGGETQLRQEVAGREQQAVDDVVERVAGGARVAVQLAFDADRVREPA